MECSNTAPASSYPAPADGTLPRPAADGDLGRTFFAPKACPVSVGLFIAHLRSFVRILWVTMYPNTALFNNPKKDFPGRGVA